MKTFIECKSVGVDYQKDFEGDLSLVLTVHDMNFFEFADKLSVDQVPALLRMLRTRQPEQWDVFIAEFA